MDDTDRTESPITESAAAESPAPESRPDVSTATHASRPAEAEGGVGRTGADSSSGWGRATPADAPDLPGPSVMLPVGNADFPETGVGTVGPGAGSSEDDITSPAGRTDEELEPPGFDTASSDASPDLTQ